MKNLSGLLALTVIISSCSSTEYVHLSVMEPAPVTLPQSIKHVGVVNRTGVAKETKIIDVVDKVFSLSSNKLEEEGSKSTINGLTDALMRNEKFTEVKPLNTGDLVTIGAGIFPSALEWDQVDRICKDNNVDALFVLELFHTDAKVSYTPNPVSMSTALGNIPGIAHEANITTTVKTGWRIYDPSTRTILDEYPIARSISQSTVAINPAVAAGEVAARKDAVKEAGGEIGRMYGARIVPYWLRVTRDYFVRGSGPLSIARRKAQTGNWNEAAALWLEETKNPSPTVAGRACYNMAIISEINGNLEEAIGWAQKAYENYNIRLGLQYVNILRNRKANMDLVKVQASQ